MGVVCRSAASVVALAGCLGLLGACSSGAPRQSDQASPTSSAAPPASTSAATSGSGPSFVMPNEVGKVLQEAQDDIQRVSRDPVFYTSSTDATGRARHQILDRDWKVCSQNVPAGERVDRATILITFSVVKLAETCPR